MPIFYKPKKFHYQYFRMYLITYNIISEYPQKTLQYLHHLHIFLYFI
jgi:hypothetical protein